MIEKFITDGNYVPTSPEHGVYFVAGVKGDSMVRLAGYCNFETVTQLYNLLREAEWFADLKAEIIVEYGQQWIAPEAAAPNNRQNLLHRGMNHAHQFAQGGSGSSILTAVKKQNNCCMICKKIKETLCISKDESDKDGSRNIRWGFCPEKLLLSVPEKLLSGIVCCVECLVVWSGTELARIKCTVDDLSAFVEYRENPTPELNARFLLRCEECGHTTNRKSNLVRHNRMHNRLKCRLCVLDFANEEKRAAHEVFHFDGTHPHSCDLDDCGMPFTRPRNMKKHKINMHLKDRKGVDRHFCPEEDYQSSFSRKGDLDEHSKKHDPTIPKPTCPYCGKPFTETSNMTRHANHRCKKRPNQGTATQSKQKKAKK